jgi:F-type H+-transporting ATPase subunit gamma
MIQAEVGQLDTVGNLTAVFENIASIRIAKIKDQVVSSSKFFSDLWNIYSQLRTDPADRITETKSPNAKDNKNKPSVYIIITSEGGLSGDIDQRIIDKALAGYEPGKVDFIVIGGHGANLLTQRHVPIARFYKLPEVDERVDVAPIIGDVSEYASATVFYETYESLGVQGVASIELISRVKTLSEDATANEIISSRDYLFEPSIVEVTEFLEATMMGLALAQMILESKLAQYASRFNAMTAAHKKANEMRGDLVMEYHRAKRTLNDERLREVISSMDML